MSALDQHFYHKSIRTYTAAFGTLFNNMYVVRDGGKTIKIPLSYSSRQKFDIQQKYENDDAHYQVKFPRIGFVLTGWERDTERMQNKHDLLYQNVDRTQVNTVNKQLNRVPYIFNFQVTVGTKNLDDMFQIMEQIAAWFNPSLNINITENPDLGIDTSLNVKMTGSNLTDDYEGQMEDEKVLISTFDFDVEGFLYMPSSSQGVIQRICLNYYDLDTKLIYEDESDCFPPINNCNIDWEELTDTQQYELKEVNRIPYSDPNQFERLIRLNNDSIIKPYGFNNELDNIFDDVYIIRYYYYSAAVDFFSIFYTYDYEQPPSKYFDTMTIYYKAYDPFNSQAIVDVKFALVSDYNNKSSSVIVESDIISEQSSENIIRKVNLKIPDGYNKAPIAIKFEKSYATLELHDIRICSDGNTVPWVQPI